MIIYNGYFIDIFMIGLSDNDDSDTADDRILTEWRDLWAICPNLSLSRLSAVLAVTTEMRITKDDFLLIYGKLRISQCMEPLSCGM